MTKKLLTLLLVLCFMLPATALAAKLSDMWVTGVTPTVTDGSEIEIHWWYGERAKRYYLFLPGTTPPNSKICFSGPETLTLNGQTIRSGDDFTVPESGTVLSFMNGRKEYPVEVVRSSGVPTLFITTESGSLEYIHRKKTNQEPGTLLMLMPDGEIAYQGALTQVKCRGNSTFVLNKKPYQIKLAEKTDLCGLGKDKTWLLLANFHDNSLLRNRITMDMARAAGLAYTPKSTFCDLYINNEYLGTYDLCTKVEPGSDRVDIPDLEKMTQAVNDAPLESYERFGKKADIKGKGKGHLIPNDPEDITGGYLLEIDAPERFVEEASGYTTKRGQPVVIKYPEYATEKQVSYISELLQNAENAIRAKDGVDPDTGRHYSEFIDVDSFALKYLLEEIVKNYDALYSSQFLYKQPDSVSTLLYAGPAWDYDRAYGNRGRKPDIVPTGFNVNITGNYTYAWYPALYRHADFRWRVQELYGQVYRPILETLLGRAESRDGLLSLDGYVELIEDSAAMNFKRWPVFNIPARPVKTGADYPENIQYLRNFLEKRVDFLDEAWLAPYEKGELAKEP